MQIHLNQKQLNNLFIGTELACELIATESYYRAFLVTQAINPSKFLNSKEISKIKFWLRKYEVRKEYLINNWDVSNDELINSIHLKDIVGIELLEQELRKYISDFSLLQESWKCDNPL